MESQPTKINIDRLPIPVDSERIAAFCQKWNVQELSLFGSVLRDDFGPDSDVDALVSFAPDAPWSLWDLVDARDQLQEIFGRRVDLIEKEALKNPFRRHSILSSRRLLHAA